MVNIEPWVLLQVDVFDEGGSCGCCSPATVVVPGEGGTGMEVTNSDIPMTAFFSGVFLTCRECGREWLKTYDGLYVRSRIGGGNESVMNDIRGQDGLVKDVFR